MNDNQKAKAVLRAMSKQTLRWCMLCNNNTQWAHLDQHMCQCVCGLIWDFQASVFLTARLRVLYGDEMRRLLQMQNRKRWKIVNGHGRAR
jgi:leucyl aminopeptidase (aminopeptidase T)